MNRWFWRERGWDIVWKERVFCSVFDAEIILSPSLRPMTLLTRLYCLERIVRDTPIEEVES